MNVDTLATAIQEAERFLTTAKALHRSLQNQPPCHYITGSLESGACRRASMDLTRALANLRKSQ